MLENGRIRLRRVRSSDAEAIFDAVSESFSELSPWLPWCTASYCLEDSKWWCVSRDDAWRERTEYNFIIEEKVSNRLLGGCGLNHINHDDRLANLGYWVRTRGSKQGIATAVVPMIATFAFDTLGLNRLEILVAEGNLPSRRVAEKSGACLEGILRQRLFVNDRFHNALLFSLVKG